jgi:hypothetical protein
LYEIIELKKLAPQINLLRLNVPLITQRAEAGQFVVLRINEEGERIPMSITDLDRHTSSSRRWEKRPRIWPPSRKATLWRMWWVLWGFPRTWKITAPVSVWGEESE